jgi:hypothetical protein
MTNQPAAGPPTPDDRIKAFNSPPLSYGSILCSPATIAILLRSVPPPLCRWSFNQKGFISYKIVVEKYIILFPFILDEAG